VSYSPCAEFAEHKDFHRMKLDMKAMYLVGT